MLEEAAEARAEGAAAAGASKRRKSVAANAANGDAAAGGAAVGGAAVGKGVSAPGAVAPASQQLLAGHRQCVAALAWREQATVISGSWDHSVRILDCCIELLIPMTTSWFTLHAV